MIWRRALLLLGTVGLLSDCGRRSQSVRSEPVDAGALGPVVSAPPRARPDLTILYTSDLRGHVSSAPTGAAGGVARRASLVDRVKLEGGAVIQVEAGDFLAGSGAGDDDVPGSPYGRELRTRIVLASYSRLGVDAVTPGERDLELGREGLLAGLRSSETSVVAANLFGQGDQRPFPPDKIVEKGGLSVGVFGILDVPAEQAPALRRWGFRLGDAAEAAKAEVQSLRSRGARLVVGLLHVAGGRARAAEILAQASGIDVAILGHAGDGEEADAAAGVGRTPVAFAGTLGAAVGRIDVRGLQSGAEPVFDDQKVLLTSAIPDQVGVAAIERAVLATLRQKAGQKEPLYPPTWTFASNAACEMCHKEQADQWSTTDHARAFAVLKKYKRDRDHECLGCHMTGYLQPGQTTNYDQTVKYFSSVGCESCHGPSSAHVRAVDKRTGTSRTVAPEVCLGCHTDDQSLVGSFDYATALKAVLGPAHGALALNPK